MLLLVYPRSRHEGWKGYQISTVAHYLHAHHFSTLRYRFCHLSGGECKLMVLTRVSIRPRIVFLQFLIPAYMHSSSGITLHSRCICPILQPLSRVGDGTNFPLVLSNSSDDHPSAQSLCSINHRNGRRQALYTHTPRWDALRPHISIIRFSRLYSRSRGDEL
jgi:hypothetical protein